jgi:hypothetical protein
MTKPFPLFCLFLLYVCPFVPHLLCIFPCCMSVPCPSFPHCVYTVS